MKKFNLATMALSVMATFAVFSSAQVQAAEPTAITIATPDEAKTFPNPDRTYVHAAQRYDAAQIRKLGLGLNKNQVRFLLGNPHFSEGILFVHTWHYLIGLKKPGTADYQVCELRVTFDKNYLVDSLKWRDASCGPLLDEPAAAPQPAPIIVPAPIIQNSADLKTYTSENILFKFNKSSEKDIVGGLSVLSRIQSDVKKNFKNIKQVSVIGFADRFGSQSYNDSLSLARAKTVARLLVERGIVPASVVDVGGQGATSSFSDSCNGQKNDTVIQCLEPDRRVQVKISGE